MELNKIRTRLLLVLLLLFFFVILFIKIPSKIQIPVKILPAREWLVIRPASGQISSLKTNYLSGQTSPLFDFIADRGEQVELNINEGLYSGQWIDSNQVIAKIRSSSLLEKIVEAEQQLKVKQAELLVFTTGEKTQIIRIYENEYQGLLEQLKIEQAILARKENLLQKNLIAPEEYQIQQAKIVELEGEANALKAKIEGLKSGAKQEQLDFIKAQIMSLNKQLRFLKQQDSLLSLRTPFAGNVVFHIQSDTLIHLTDHRKLSGVFLMPFFENYSSFIGKQVILKGEPLPGSITGRIIRFSSRAVPVKGRNMIYGFLELENSGMYLPANLLLEGQIVKEVKPAWHYLWEFLKSFFNE